MVDINTTCAALIKPEWTDKVPSPAYDSLTPVQRRETRLANPWSFLNVTLSPEDVASRPDSQHIEEVSNDQLITLARESIDRITTAGAFEHNADCLFLYRLQRDNHSQTAIVTEVATNDYQSGRVKIHEQVREARAELLAEHLNKLKIISSPIAMTYRNTSEISELVKNVQSADPDLQLGTLSGVHQTIWKITDQALIKQLKDAFISKSLYIIDGHHRAAATVAANNINKHSDSLPLFSALFPHDELKLSGFNRWIRPTEETHVGDEITSLPNASVIPDYQAPECGMLTVYTGTQWISLKLLPDQDNKAENTDVALLQTQLLGPVFGITRADDPRIINMPGNQPAQQLRDTIDKQGGIAIFVAPMTIEDFLAVADSDDLLPPKSTYFTPKVQSGIFLRSTGD